MVERQSPTRDEEAAGNFASGDRLARIRALNDTLREGHPTGRVLISNGVDRLSPTRLVTLLLAVQQFKEFDADNDPYGEHDFGAIELFGTKFFWKIDYYDRTLICASPDPADPEITTRTLTIMRADEY